MTAINKSAEWIWPSIVDTISAQKASKQGLLASSWCAGATIFLVILAKLGEQVASFDMLALADAFLFILIGWGIYKLYRFAAIAGLALYILERISMWVEHGPKNPVIALIIMLMFVNAIRGIFAYHNFIKQ